ncbi:MAG: hypothetical protein KME08_02325 [Aphanothece sp. CMT-3BRIN-NPC111]|jgi:uncharacterized membrane protein (DUF106 family)|nr:hypothetical protein [Aphanothece sp. CMT-3BRIN-NPC111]
MNDKEKEDRKETVDMELKEVRDRLKNTNIGDEEWKALDKSEDKLMIERLNLSQDYD